MDVAAGRVDRLLGGWSLPAWYSAAAASSSCSGSGQRARPLHAGARAHDPGAGRVALLFRARPASASQRSWIWKFAVIGGIACAGPLSPVLYGLGERNRRRSIRQPADVLAQQPARRGPAGLRAPESQSSRLEVAVGRWPGDGSGRVRRVHGRVQLRRHRHRGGRPALGTVPSQAVVVVAHVGIHRIVARPLRDRSRHEHLRPGPVGVAPLRARHQRRAHADAICHRRGPWTGHADGRRAGGAWGAMAASTTRHRLGRHGRAPVRAGSRSPNAVLRRVFSSVGRHRRRPAAGAGPQPALRGTGRPVLGRRLQRPVSVRADASWQAAHRRLPVPRVAAAAGRA